MTASIYDHPANLENILALCKCITVF